MASQSGGAQTRTLVVYVVRRVITSVEKLENKNHCEAQEYYIVQYYYAVRSSKQKALVQTKGTCLAVMIPHHTR